MAGGRRNRGRRYNPRRMDEEDLWFAFADRRGVRPTIHWKALWDLTAAMVARSVARRLEVDVCLFVSITINHLAELLFTGDWERSSRTASNCLTRILRVS